MNLNLIPFFIAFGLVCAVAGWALIESAIWFFESINISFS